MLTQFLIGFYNEYKMIIKEDDFVLRYPPISLFPLLKSIYPNCLFYMLELDNIPMNFYLIGILAILDCEISTFPQHIKGRGGASMMFADLPA